MRESARARARRRLDQQAFLLGRRAVQERSNYACEAKVASDCAGLGCLAHHIARRSHAFGPERHAASNLLWLCRFCHDWVHANPAESYDRGFLVRSA